MIAHPSVEEHDAFVLVIQIHTPFLGERLVHPVLPREVWVPNSVMTALENSVDNDKTGDVKVICLCQPLDRTAKTARLTTVCFV